MILKPKKLTRSRFPLFFLALTPFLLCSTSCHANGFELAGNTLFSRQPVAIKVVDVGPEGEQANQKADEKGVNQLPISSFSQFKYLSAEKRKQV